MAGGFNAKRRTQPSDPAGRLARGLTLQRTDRRDARRRRGDGPARPRYLISTTMTSMVLFVSLTSLWSSPGGSGGSQ
jgi:hypothetical protein